LAAPAAAGAELTGRLERAIDGDTFVLTPGGVVVRLHGIDAFERGQTCGPEAWPCGARAARWLDAILRGHSIRCQVVTTTEDHTLADCITGGPLRIGRLLVRLGLALPDPVSGGAYQADEAWARKHSKGAWFHPPFVPPWEYRGE
jgi:endonuclease YncB( thermonuclease family)